MIIAWRIRSAVALHFAYYNFCRVHRTLRVTPAMQAGLTDHVWSIAELLQAAQNGASQMSRRFHYYDGGIA